MLRAAVEHDLAGERIAGVVQDLAQHRLAPAAARARPAAGAAARFRRSGTGACCNACALRDLLRSAARAFSLLQASTATRNSRPCRYSASRGASARHLQRIQHGAGDLAHHGQRVASAHRPPAARSQCSAKTIDLGAGRGALLEEWRRTVFHQSENHACAGRAGRAGMAQQPCVTPACPGSDSAYAVRRLFVREDRTELVHALERHAGTAHHAGQRIFGDDAPAGRFLPSAGGRGRAAARRRRSASCLFRRCRRRVRAASARARS